MNRKSGHQEDQNDDDNDDHYQQELAEAKSMWQTRNLITVILVFIVVGLVVVNTVQLETIKTKREAVVLVKAAGSERSSRGNETSNERPKQVSGHQDNDKQQLRRDGGQLETFNSESTGLGDLEGADSLKKMLKRSAMLARPLHGLAPNQQMRARRDQPDEEETTMAEAMRLITSINQLLINENADDQDEPIQVSRRTVERLLDEVGGPEQEASGGGQETTSGQPSATRGEFNSRVSLLTMRKVPEPEELLIKPSSPIIFGVDQQEISWAPRGGAAGPIRITKQPHEDDTNLEEAILVGMDQNYLPRVARAFM